MTYNILIADDEMLARYSLRTLISKNFDNLQVAGEAENGRQAIEMAEELKPEIIIMDIKMPGINGLEASRQILKSSPETIIIILSAHDNFSYVQEAINEGVKSYLLKPFQKKDMIEKLTAVTGSLQKKKSENLIQHELKPFLEEEFIALLIGDNEDKSLLTPIKKVLDTDYKSGSFVVINWPEYSETEQNQAVKLLKKKLPCIVSARTGCDRVFYIPSENSISAEAARDTVIKEYVSQLGRLFKGFVECGCGQILSGFPGLEQSYYQAVTALKSAAGEPVFYNRNFKTNHLVPEVYPHEKESLLLEKIQERKFDEAEQLISDLCGSLSSMKNLPLMKEYAARFCGHLIRTTHTRGSDTDAVLGVSPFLIHDLMELNSAAEVKHLVKTAGMKIIQKIQSDENREGWWLEKAFNYMKKNLYSEISLDIIAGKIQISPQHLSKIFKQKYGKTIVEYITDQRMDYARYLLSSSNYTIREISSKTGYTDQNYFSRVFKKHTGQTPSAYKESN